MALDGFDGQLPILDQAVQTKTVIGLLPTGGGKSLTYQLAAMLQPGITIIIDPIRSLMVDQYNSLKEIGIDKCEFINSTLKPAERNFNQHNLLAKGQLEFIFVSPERFVIAHSSRYSIRVSTFSKCLIVFPLSSYSLKNLWGALCVLDS